MEVILETSFGQSTWLHQERKTVVTIRVGVLAHIRFERLSFYPLLNLKARKLDDLAKGVWECGQWRH